MVTGWSVAHYLCVWLVLMFLFQVVSQDGMERILCDILRLVRDGGKDGVKLERLVALHDRLRDSVGEGESNTAAKELLQKMEEKERDESQAAERTKQQRNKKKWVFVERNTIL